MNDPRFGEVLAELQAMRDAKGEGYDTEVPYANIRQAKEWGLPAWLGAVLRAGDKHKRLQAYFRSGDLPFESVEDAFIDAAVYYIIGLILFREEQAGADVCGMAFCAQPRAHGGACKSAEGAEEDIHVVGDKPRCPLCLRLPHGGGCK